VSRIDDLIRQHCPDGVAHKLLGELGRFERGSGIQKSDFVEEGVGCIHYGQIHTHYGTWATETKSFVTPEQAERTRRAKPGDLVIATTSEDDEAVGKAVAWLGAEEVAVSTDAFIYRHSLDPKYVAYFFQTEQFHTQKRRHVTGAKVRRIAGSALAKIRIPVPPLEVQAEIVRVLDLFQSLEAELEAELEARRHQFAHWHDTLLDFRDDANVQRLPTASLLREPLANGRSVPDGDGYPVLRLTALHGSVVDLRQQKRGTWDEAAGRRFRIESGDILVARGNGSKELIARACMVEEAAEVAFPDTMIRIRPNLDLVSQRFLYYVWESREIRRAIEQRAKISSGVWKISQEDLARIVLPVPPLSLQTEIVSTLDKFDALVNDLSVGLPAELVARRQQYEHYRDRLLSFEEAA
jgi:type I restriction enzyme S subunit